MFQGDVAVKNSGGPISKRAPVNSLFPWLDEKSQSELLGEKLVHDVANVCLQGSISYLPAGFQSLIKLADVAWHLEVFECTLIQVLLSLRACHGHWSMMESLNEHWLFAFRAEHVWFSCACVAFLQVLFFFFLLQVKKKCIWCELLDGKFPLGVSACACLSLYLACGDLETCSWCKHPSLTVSWDHFQSPVTQSWTKLYLKANESRQLDSAVCFER